MANPRRKDPELKLVEAGLLLDAYGALLTDRQRQFMRLHFEEDLSFSQIARDFSISRQAVHDSVKHAVSTLRHFEEVLKLVENSGDYPLPHPTQIGGRQLIQRLAAIRDHLRGSVESLNPTWAASELDELLGLLQGNQPETEPVLETPSEELGGGNGQPQAPAVPAVESSAAAVSEPARS